MIYIDPPEWVVWVVGIFVVLAAVVNVIEGFRGE